MLDIKNIIFSIKNIKQNTIKLPEKTKCSLLLLGVANLSGRGQRPIIPPKAENTQVFYNPEVAKICDVNLVEYGRKLSKPGMVDETSKTPYYHKMEFKNLSCKMIIQMHQTMPM